MESVVTPKKFATLTLIICILALIKTQVKVNTCPSLPAHELPMRVDFNNFLKQLMTLKSLAAMDWIHLN